MKQPGDRAGGAFTRLLFAQVTALFGEQLVGFALGIWLFQRTGLVTSNSVMAVATTLPIILCAPLAGVLVDRLGPRPILWLGAAAGGASAVVMLMLERSGQLGVWSAAILVATAMALRSGEYGAISTATTMLVPAAKLSRANGMAQLAAAIPQLVAPVAAGFLLPTLGIVSILAVNVASAVPAVLIFYLVRIGPRAAPAPDQAKSSVVQEALVAWRYIRERPGLVGLLLFFAALNFNIGVVQVVVTPLILSFAGPRELGIVMSVGGTGMVLGSVLMSVWGGPRSRVGAILGATLMQGATLLAGGLHPSVALVSCAAFGVMFTFPVITVSCQMIWQRKVPFDLQGRVTSFRLVVAGATVPVACALAGPLADRAFEPLMTPGGALASTVGHILGVGPGRGIGLLLVVLGAATLAIAIVGLLSVRLRRVEEELPDHEVSLHATTE